MIKRVLTVRILVNADNDADAHDGLNEMLHNEQGYGFVLDWSYVGEPGQASYNPATYSEGDFVGAEGIKIE